MSITPSDDDFDWSQLDDVFQEVDVSDVQDVTSLADLELLDVYRDLTEELKEQGTEALRPTLQSSRDKHSRRNACWVELRKRGLL